VNDTFRRQIYTAQLLAEHLGHEWACALTPEDLHEIMADCSDIHTAVAAISDATFARRSEYSLPCGITAPHVQPDGVITHATGTGRLRWRIDTERSIWLSVWRPRRIEAAWTDGALEAVEWGHPLCCHFDSSDLALCAFQRDGADWILIRPVGGPAVEIRHSLALANALCALSPSGDVNEAFYRAGVELPALWDADPLPEVVHA